MQRQHALNTLRPRQNGRLFADDTFKRIFSNDNIRISIKNSLKFVPKGLINNSQALVLIMAWRRPGDKPLSEPMMVRSLTHICVTRPQWVNMLLSSLIQDNINIDVPWSIFFKILTIHPRCYIRTIAVPETCENWLGLVNSSHGALKSTVVEKTVLRKCSLFGIKDLQTSEMTVKIKCNMYVWHVNIFLILTLYTP